MRRVDNSANALQLGLDQFVARFSTGWKARAPIIWNSIAAADDSIADAPPPGLSEDTFLILDGRILHEAVFTYATIGSTGATASELRQAVGLNTASFTGAGVKVGVLSDSFNNLGGAAQDEASGELPPASRVQVLKDLAGGGSDEGRAMMQIVHDIAPGSDLAFYTAFNSEQDFANGILALAAAGCKVIVDDVAYFDEPFFQNGIVAQAIEAVEAQGVVYVTAAGNNASNAYQAAWTPISGSYAGVNLVDAESFGGSIVQTLTIGANSSYVVPFILEWDQPYGAVTSDLQLLVFRNGALLGTATNDTYGEPNNPWVIVGLRGGATYQIAIKNLSGPDPGLIKEIVEGNGLPVTLNGANVGSVYGHAMTPVAVTVGAVSTARTPAFGVSPAQSESFSASGAGTLLLFEDDGDRVASPVAFNSIDLSGVDNIHTTLPNGLSDFYGTSAAAPSVAAIVALMLQANPGLTPAQVEQILKNSTLAMTNPAVGGAGLVQADAAIAQAAAMLSLGAGQVLTVLAGQTVNGLIVLSGGMLNVSPGGTVSMITLNGGTAFVLGTAISTVINAGMEGVLSGGTTSGTSVNSGTQFVFSGGLASGTMLISAGNQVVLSGGVGSATTVNSGGQEGVYGSAVNTIINTGGQEYVWAGGIANAQVVNGGILSEQPGGISIGTILNGGGVDAVNTGAAVSGAIVNSGTQFVFSGGWASGTTLNSAGNQVVLGGGVASATTVNSGGQEGVYGSAVNLLINLGGQEFVWAGGIANGQVVNGGILSEQPGGIGIGTILNGGGVDVVNTGARASGAMVNSGAQYVLGGGWASGTTLNSGGNQVVLSGGTTSAPTVNGGGQVGVYGSAVNAIINSGGSQYVWSGGSDRGASANGGIHSIQPGGIGISTTVNGGGYDVVNAGAAASGTIVNSGTQFVFGGGSASGTTLNSGLQVVLGGGTTSATTVNNGGQVGIYGSSVDTIINSGGREYVSLGGIDIGAHVNSGGFQRVVAGGIASAAIISGGTLEVMSGGSIGAGAVTFASSGGGTLQLDDSVHFGGQIAGFGEPDHIDLRDIAFGSSTTLAFVEAAGNTSGTLTVSDGTHTANITLLGQYITAQFTKASDGHGGTLIGDPPVVAMTQSPTLTNPHQV